MSGHSKWSNIRRKKEASDAAKGAVFTKFAKEIAVAVKAGGPDPNSNSRLKVVVSKAKAANTVAYGNKVIYPTCLSKKPATIGVTIWAAIEKV